MGFESLPEVIIGCFRSSEASRVEEEVSASGQPDLEFLELPFVRPDISSPDDFSRKGYHQKLDHGGKHEDPAVRPLTAQFRAMIASLSKLEKKAALFDELRGINKTLRADLKRKERIVAGNR